ncbi:MAG: aminotransferase class V-fold PLP-dependent enzyme [Christensenellales bacterium]
MIFTGGGTESDNLAILGVAETLRQSAGFVCSAIEHPAVAGDDSPCGADGAHGSCAFRSISRGVVDLAACETVIDEHTALVSCMQVSNETGAIQPVEELAKLARRKDPNVRVHVDGVQGFMRVPMRMERMGVDFVCAQRSQDSRAEGHRRAGGASEAFG